MESDMEDENAPIEYDSAYLNSLRELKILSGLGFLALAYTIGYSSQFGYSVSSPENLKTVLGMPHWIFWGVLVPWIVTAALTIGFALFVMRDDDEDLVASESCEASGADGEEL